ncbi:DUF1904 family protein [Neobacillus sp. CF12]|uniref:DUF1904 family protein n=1 Tax=Neobacillus sp. CF12 TaxID=3055864 RepID=UPI0025A14C1E|nr:DUF1904 family protein [Neobacillus sp. CF12]MDM5326981.1 DUF1904 family protein [Neobacillus sp. CF12]
MIFLYRYVHGKTIFYFTLEIVQSTYVFVGDEVQGYPLIEVKWFERGQEIQDQFAKIVTNIFTHSEFQR